MRILFIRYYLEKNRFIIKLILKRVIHKIKRIHNFVVVNVISFFMSYFILCILLSGCKRPLVLMLVVISAPSVECCKPLTRDHPSFKTAPL